MKLSLLHEMSTGDVGDGVGRSFFRPRAKKTAGTIKVPAAEGQNLGVDNPDTSAVSFQKTGGGKWQAAGKPGPSPILPSMKGKKGMPSYG